MQGILRRLELCRDRLQASEHEHDVVLACVQNKILKVSLFADITMTACTVVGLVPAFFGMNLEIPTGFEFTQVCFWCTVALSILVVVSFHCLAGYTAGM